MMNLIRELKQSYVLQDQEQDVINWVKGCLGLSLTDICTLPREVVSEVQLQRLQEGCDQLGKGVPLAYLLGHGEWNGELWFLTEDVLIPRPETKVLLDVALMLGTSDATVLELGTGSGILAVSMARAKPRWDITATDASKRALQVAKENARGVSVKWVCHDWDQLWAFECVDQVVANPPYLKGDDPHLDKLMFEPHKALVSGPTGLECFQRIAEQAATVLKPGGRIVFEHGNRQAHEVGDLLLTLGFSQIKQYQDDLGWSRVTEGSWGV